MHGAERPSRRSVSCETSPSERYLNQLIKFFSTSVFDSLRALDHRSNMRGLQCIIFICALTATQVTNCVVNASSNQVMGSSDYSRVRRQAYGPANGWQPCWFADSGTQLSCYGCPGSGPCYICAYGSEPLSSWQTGVSLLNHDTLVARCVHRLSRMISP
jgi:hypothetical protein